MPEPYYEYAPGSSTFRLAQCEWFAVVLADTAGRQFFLIARRFHLRQQHRTTLYIISVNNDGDNITATLLNHADDFALPILDFAVLYPEARCTIAITGNDLPPCSSACHHQPAPISRAFVQVILVRNPPVRDTVCMSGAFSPSFRAE